MKNAEVIFQPELLTRIDRAQALAYAKNDRYHFERKRDGDRRTIAFDSGLFMGFNKLGQIVPVEDSLKKAIAKLEASCILDGELEGSEFWAWDILMLDGKDLSELPQGERKMILAGLLVVGGPLLRFVPHVSGEQNKLDFLEAMEEMGAEGIVVKDTQAKYRGGRVGAHFKLKFEIDASFVVGPKPKPNDGKRTVGLYIFDPRSSAGFRWQKDFRLVATVKITTATIPEIGKVIDCRYLYAFTGENGKIFQPVYFGKIRTDVRPEDCTADQLKYKDGGSNGLSKQV